MTSPTTQQCNHDRVWRADHLLLGFLQAPFGACAASVPDLLRLCGWWKMGSRKPACFGEQIMVVGTCSISNVTFAY